jgi:DNA-binding response OmpR family regulator
MAKILVVEDNLELAAVVQDTFGSQHAVEMVHSGADAMDRLKFYTFDLIILDWGLPDIEGIEVCAWYRGQKGAAAVLMLTGKDQLNEKLTGLDSGADDYLTKPFNVSELQARVRALLRRPTQFTGDLVTVGPLVLDSKNMTVTREGKPIDLLPKEYALLAFLMKYPNEYFTAEALMERVWPSESDTSPDILRVYVTRLRKKIDRDGEESLIATRRGAGYMLAVPAKK